MGATYTWFLANTAELAVALPGWLPPPAPQLPGTQRTIDDLFTGRPTTVWDFGNDDRPEPDPSAEQPDIDDLPQVTRGPDPLTFARSLEALCGESADKTSSLILSLRLVGPEDAGCEVLAVPSNLVQCVAGWPAEALSSQGNWAVALRELAQTANATGRGMYLLWQI
jgi:hypothetical protein